jgi:hypothetical protein
MRKIPTLLIISAILFSFSCKKQPGPEGPAGPPGPAGPGYTGAIRGHVNIYDEHGYQVLFGYSDVQLKLKGGKTINADATGHFLFDSVSTGAYSIEVSGVGLASTIVYNIPFVKDTFYQPISISKKPEFQLTSFNAYHNGTSEYDSLVVTFPVDTRPRTWVVFVGADASVSSSNYLLSYVRTINGSTFQTSAVFRIHAQEFNNAGLFFGQTAYFAAYSYVINDASVYKGISTGKNVYNAVGNVFTSSASVP